MYRIIVNGGGRELDFESARSVAGRTVIVTGGGSGIGRSTAEIFALAGARVVVTDLNQSASDETAKGVTNLGGEAVSCQYDVANGQRAHEIVGRCVEQFGGVDMIVNNAGFPAIGAFASEGYDAMWQSSLDVMLSGPMHLISAALPHLRASDCPRIVNVASIEGLGGQAHGTAYSAAKAGLIGLTRTLAVEFGKEGITVNALCPGPILTGMTKDTPADYQRKYIERYTSLRRPGEPEEIAHMILNLCLPASAFVTGAVIVVDGGLTARNS